MRNLNCEKKEKISAALGLLCVFMVLLLGSLALSGCSVFEDWGKADVQVDFGQYQNPPGDDTGAADPSPGEDTSQGSTGQGGDGQGAESSDPSGAADPSQEQEKPEGPEEPGDAQGQDSETEEGTKSPEITEQPDKTSQEKMEAFQKSEFSQELLAYFEANGRGDEAFTEPIFDSESRVYSKEELEKLSDVMCKIFRNEIYARHGMIFGDEDLNQLYGPFSWYEGTISLRDFEAQEELPFNTTEYANIKNVVAVEKARKQ